MQFLQDTRHQQTLTPYFSLGMNSAQQEGSLHEGSGSYGEHPQIFSLDQSANVFQ